MTTPDISRPVCILGLGLIGGSLLRDLHATSHDVFGYNRSQSGVAAATAEGFDVSSDLIATLKRAAKLDALIVIAVPLTALDTLLDAISDHAPECGFSDVISVKAAVYDAVRKRNMQDRYVGSHPMAGTAESGWTAAQTGLFKGAAWVISFDYLVDAGLDSVLDSQPVAQRWIDIWKDVAQLALAVDAEVVPARALPHDAAVARISHLPHIFAESMAIVGDNGGALSLSLAASSFRDATRVAGTAPDLVRAMCEGNARALVEALDEAIELLIHNREQLIANPPTIEQLTENGYRSRLRFEARASNSENSHRPVLRVNPGGKDWEKHLVEAESLGARIEVF